MRIAIPIFGPRVSPRFDCAADVTIVDVRDGVVRGRSRDCIKELRSWQRVERLVELGVEVVLVGGMRRCDYWALVAAGLEVYSGFTGEAEEALKRFLADGPSSVQARSALPGHGRKVGQRWGRRGRRAR